MPQPPVQRLPGAIRPSPRQLAWALAALLLTLAVVGPRATPDASPAARTFVFVDLSQSMGVADQLIDGRPVSRLDFVRRALADVIEHLPCGASIGLGLFAGHRSIPLFAPVEVCENRADLLAALPTLSLGSAWMGNSEIAKGYYGAWELVAERSDQPALVFITDGHEAPPVNPRYRPAFPGRPGELRALLTGVGGDLPLPIPRRDPEGRDRGVWGPDDVLQVDPYSLPRTQDSRDLLVQSEAIRPGDEGAAGTPGREHLSALRADYLALLASETGARFQRLETLPDLTRAIATLHGTAAGPRPRSGSHWLIVAALGLFVGGLVSGWWREPRFGGRHPGLSRPGLSRPGLSRPGWLRPGWLRRGVGGPGRGSRPTAASDRKPDRGARA